VLWNANGFTQPAFDPRKSILEVTSTLDHEATNESIIDAVNAGVDLASVLLNLFIQSIKSLVTPIPHSSPA
jgi:hypothetical protein